MTTKQAVTDPVSIARINRRRAAAPPVARRSSLRRSCWSTATIPSPMMPASMSLASASSQTPRSTGPTRPSSSPTRAFRSSPIYWPRSFASLEFRSTTCLLADSSGVDLCLPPRLLEPGQTHLRLACRAMVRRRAGRLPASPSRRRNGPRAHGPLRDSALHLHPARTLRSRRRHRPPLGSRSALSPASPRSCTRSWPSMRQHSSFSLSLSISAIRAARVDSEPLCGSSPRGSSIWRHSMSRYRLPTTRPYTVRCACTCSHPSGHGTRTSASSSRWRFSRFAAYRLGSQNPRRQALPRRLIARNLQHALSLPLCPYFRTLSPRPAAAAAQLPHPLRAWDHPSRWLPGRTSPESHAA